MKHARSFHALGWDGFEVGRQQGLAVELSLRGLHARDRRWCQIGVLAPTSTAGALTNLARRCEYSHRHRRGRTLRTRRIFRRLGDVIRAASFDSRFVQCLEQMVAKGVATRLRYLYERTVNVGKREQ